MDTDGIMKIQQKGPFLWKGNGHIIFDRIQPPQDEIKETNSMTELWMQLLDHTGKGAGRQVEESVALKVALIF